MIDIGVNLANAAFEDDRDAVLARAQAAGVQAMVVTGTSVADSCAALALAQQRDGLFATAGVHPHEAGAVEPDWAERVAELAAAVEVVAIGETGLDYYRNYAPRDAQRRVFRRQAELAVNIGLPLFVHDRDSAGDTRAVLRDFRNDLAACVIHCFTGSEEDLEGYLEDGYSIGVTGWICDERRGTGLAALAPRIPAERLMIETDAPYLLPRTITPRPRSRRNEPAFLPWVAKRLAACRGEDAAVLERRTHDNAARFFRLPARFQASEPRTAGG